MIRAFLALCLVGCPRASPPPSSEPDVTDPSPEASALRRAVTAARESHVRAEFLPDFGALTALIDDLEDEGLARLPALERFIALEVRPERARQLPQSTVVGAYAEALRTLPADWWGMHGALTSPAAKRLREMPGADPALLRLLDDTTAIHYLEDDGEASTEAEDWSITVADLAAELLALRHDLAFDAWQPDPAVRTETRRALAQQLGARP
ncbi:MAG: hypothetical protein EA397_17430 [Deltaproteobacteria bacterium]|nr:MAG: hypothetical protein EA397_17430 [Deltaproteobacteria bacterium]